MSAIPSKKRGQTLTSECNALEFGELCRIANETFPDAFQLIPPIGDMMYLDQTLDKYGSAKKLFIGYLESEEKTSEDPLWAYLKTPSHVEFITNGDEKVTNRRKANATLYPPFNHLGLGLKKQYYPQLDSLIAYYIVAAGHWRLFVDGGRTTVSLEGLKRACETVSERMCEMRESEMADAEWEDYDPDPDSLFVPEVFPRRKKDKTKDRLIENLSIKHVALKEEANAMERALGKKIEELETMEPKFGVAMRLLEEGSKISEEQKARMRELLRN